MKETTFLGYERHKKAADQWTKVQCTLSFDPQYTSVRPKPPLQRSASKSGKVYPSRSKLTLGEHLFDLSVTRTSQGRMAIRSLALVGNFGPPISSHTPPMLVSCSRCFRIFSFFPLGSTSSASLDVHSEPLPYYCTKKCRRYSTAANTMLPSVARQPQVAHLQVALMVKTPESGMLPRFSSLLDMPWYNLNPSKTCRLSLWTSLLCLMLVLPCFDSCTSPL